MEHEDYFHLTDKLRHIHIKQTAQGHRTSKWHISAFKSDYLKLQSLSPFCYKIPASKKYKVYCFWNTWVPGMTDLEDEKYCLWL